MRSAPLPEVDRYRVIRRMTTGATTDVLLASRCTAEGRDQTVVLKVLLERYARDEQFAGAFVAAGTDYARLAHPAIVQLYEVLRESRPVLVLEHVDGLSLPRLRGMLKAVGYEIDDTAAIHMAAEMFSALAAAHEACDPSGAAAPVVHRYMSPAATSVSWAGDVRVRDFGLPKPLNHDRLVVIARGVDGYMAPEQVTGSDVTPAADVYSAALVLWELLTRTRAFPRTKRKLAMLRAMAEPQFASLDTLRPDVDERVREVLRRALAPAVSDRTASAHEVAVALRDVVSDERGRERMVAMMEMVRHGPTPVLSDAPPSMQVREPSLSSDLAPEPVTTQVSVRLPPPPAAPRVASIPRPPRAQPVALSRTSAAGAVALARSTPMAKPLSSGTMPAVRRLEEAEPEPAPSAELMAVPVVMIGEPSAPAAPTAPAVPAMEVTAPANELAQSPTEPEAFHTLPKIMVLDLPEAEESRPTDVDPLPVPMTPLAAFAPPGVEERRVDRNDPTMELAWRRRSGFGALTVITVAGFVLVGWTIGHFIRSATRAAPADALPAQVAPVVTTAPPSASQPLPSPSPPSAPPQAHDTNARVEAIERAAPPAPANAAEDAPSIPPAMGLLHSTNLKPGRRIFVDGRAVGETPKSLLVKCGQQTVKVGSAGRKQIVDIPCGEAFTLTEP